MNPIAIYSFTSPLHQAEAVDAVASEFLNSLKVDYDFRGDDFTHYGDHMLDLIFIRTGGTEGIFRQMLPILLEKSSKPFYLLTSGKSNSLAASMEILSYIQKNQLQGEIIHGSAEYIRQRVLSLSKTMAAKKQLNECRIGVIGKPSDWLIASDVDAGIVKQKMGVTLVNIPMTELLEAINQTHGGGTVEKKNHTPLIDAALPGAYRIYDALKAIIGRYHLNGLTLRCFDLLNTVHNTGCLALAKLNAEGIVAGCEGDIPTAITMMLALATVGETGFQANPSQINVETCEVLFAHCTIPFNMVERYEYDTHFESGIGVGIRGFVKEGPVTIIKVSGDGSRHFIAEGQLLQCQSNPDLCRTQLLIKLDDKSAAAYFLTQPIGNHHVILRGRHQTEFQQLMSTFSR